jgi:hypothetical protein
MTLEEFRKEFIENVHAVAAADENFTWCAFVDVASRNLADAGEIADFESCHYRGVGSRNRALWMDGFAFDDVDGSVRLLVADWRGGPTMDTLTQTEAKEILGRGRAFTEDALSGRLHEALENSTEEYALAKSLFNRRDEITRYRIYLVSDRILSARARDWPESAIGEVPVEFHVWDIARLHRVMESKTGRDDLEIDFTKYQPGGLHCLAASVESDQYKAYLCVIPGGVLAKLYDEYGSRLLEGNVRSYLSLKVKINKGIRRTILVEPGMFFAYNNGIATTATNAEVKELSSGLKLIRVKDLQIVNGGQTTATLSTTARRDKAMLDGVFVQMKLSVIPPDRAGAVIPDIARYANSQNKVSEADFFSNHEFHQRIEQISRRIWAPPVGGAQHETHWFYERARGQFANEQATMSRGERTRFLIQNPREQVITKTDLAKVENVFRCLPHIVSMGAQKNFIYFAGWISECWDKDNTVFNEEYFRRAVVKTILFRSVEKLVPEQSWYQGGYRAQLVAYTNAKLSSMIQCAGTRELNYAAIWSRLAISPALHQQLKAIATAIFEPITNPPVGFHDVGEWCKKEQCWKRVLDLPIDLHGELIAELTGRNSDRRSRAEARTQQDLDNSIGAQIKVVELGKGYWLQLAAWARARRLVTDEQDKLLSLVCQLPKKIPTDWHSEKLLQLKLKMEEEGFPSP